MTPFWFFFDGSGLASVLEGIHPNFRGGAPVALNNKGKGGEGVDKVRQADCGVTAYNRRIAEPRSIQLQTIEVLRSLPAVA